MTDENKEILNILVKMASKQDRMSLLPDEIVNFLKKPSVFTNENDLFRSGREYEQLVSIGSFYFNKEMANELDKINHICIKYD